MTCRSDPPRLGEAGFTLIELIVVIAIMALMMTIVASQRSPVSPATHARAAAREVAGALRSARSEAIMTNRSISFTVDAAERRYWWGQRTPQLLPRDLSVALLTSRNQMVSDSVGAVRFDPDGGSTGGRVAIAGGDNTWWVGVDWLSGRVSVVQKPR
jgi:general secretion pathway protein H